MAYEITGASVTSGLTIRLREMFPDATITRDAIPAQLITAYPLIVVNQLTVDSQSERRNHWWINYLVNIRYHVVADPASIPGRLQTELDMAAMKLLSELEVIYWDGVPIRLTGRRCEKIDGVLHFFCNVRVMATEPVELGPLQGSLDINANIGR